MTNYFELYQLPVTFSPNQAAVKNKYYELSRQYHPDRYAQAGGGELANALTMSAMNNEAYKTFKSEDATMAYLLKMNGVLEDEEKYSLPPAFLMEMMDINEAVSDCELEPGNIAAIEGATGLLTEQLAQWEQATRQLTNRYEQGETETDLLLKIKDQYFRKKYLLRIKERIDRFAAH